MELFSYLVSAVCSNRKSNKFRPGLRRKRNKWSNGWTDERTDRKTSFKKETTASAEFADPFVIHRGNLFLPVEFSSPFCGLPASVWKIAKGIISDSPEGERRRSEEDARGGDQSEGEGGRKKEDSTGRWTRIESSKTVVKSDETEEEEEDHEEEEKD